MKLFFTVLFSFFLASGIAQRVSSVHFFYFNSGSENLTVKEVKKLGLVCDTLLQRTLVSVTVSGHTDDSGSEESNLILSEKRASSVKKLLIENGISENIISLVASGESDPMETNKSNKAKARNRRVEVMVVFQK